MLKIIKTKYLCFMSGCKLQYLLLSILSGFMLALSFQKFNIFFIAWISFIPLIHCVFKNNVKYSLIYGFLTGLSCNIISLYWMPPFLLNNTKELLDSIVVSTMLWFYFSLYFSLWAGMLSFIKKYSFSFILIIFSAASWVGLEFIRTYIMTGLPWNLLGYSQASFLHIIQISEITGVYGISFIIILINMLLYLWLLYKNKKYLVFSVFIIGSLLIYGFIRISVFDNKYGDKINVGIVQPNINQYKKWSIPYKREIVYKLYKNARYFKDKDVDIIIYPETVLPGYLQKDKDIQRLINDIAPFTKLSLIGGMSLISDKRYNTVFFISADGKIINQYNKIHLVVFGEYIPFKFMLSKLLTSLNTTGDISKENDMQILEYDDIVFGTNICSENFYPYFSRQLVLKGANILTNHTNDAWFFDMATPYQHFVMNIFRAVENRKNVIVSANTGISAVIAANGKVIVKTKVGENVSFVSHVYKNKYLTIYDEIGDSFSWICLLFSMLILVVSILKKIIKNRNK